MQEIISHFEGLSLTGYKKGDVIYQEGKSGAQVYILKEGSVAVTAFGNEICKLNTPGTILGEVSVLLEADYSATVTAQTDTTFYVIDDLFSLFKEKPEICMKVARLLALRLQNMNMLYGEIKHEIEKMQTDEKTKKSSSKLYNLVLKMDAFWGRDVMNPMGKSVNK